MLVMFNIRLTFLVLAADSSLVIVANIPHSVTRPRDLSTTCNIKKYGLAESGGKVYGNFNDLPMLVYFKNT